ncbi:MAG: SusC/RagA family TonB-linked outer membrane protein [Sphingobacteriales bacterium]|nr:MAG: SusC/RagA family TonB-linked outer membrane protein [Sphingobacteriales bacterium]
MRKVITQLLVCMLLFAHSAFAQERQIRGTVTSGGQPVPFVNVVVKGTTIGVATDIDGNYVLTVPQTSSTIVISGLGYSSKEVNIENGTTFNVELTEDALNLDEVVITANAIERQKRSLGYATTDIKSDELTQGRDRSALNAMQGKVAGVNITSASGSPGSSTRIVIRGGSSITGNNQALIVVDGIPIDNSSFQTSDQLNNQVDFGSRGNDINPEDIESITVLKGPAAAALYGSRASNGAVLITTKSGRGNSNKKGAEIGFSSSITFEDILRLPEFQNDYGQGGNGAPDPRENFSWGPKFDDKIRPWGQEIGGERRVKPYSAIPNNVKEFFDIGSTITNTLSLSGGTDKATYYTSFSSLNNKGVIPTTYYNRHSFKFSGQTELSNKFSSSASINYIKTGANVSTQGQNFSAYDQVLQTPRDIPLLELKDYNNNKFNTLEGYYGAYTLNPYYILDNSRNLNDVDRILGNAQLSYKAADWLNLVGRIGTDFYTDRREQRQARFLVERGQNEGQENIGLYSEAYYKVSELTTDLMATFQKELSEDFSLSVLVGHNVRQRRLNYASASTAGLVIPGFYNLNNSEGPPVVDNSISLRRLYGVYTDINLNFRNFFFVGLTARNDWSSTLPQSNNSFFYPGVNTSLVFTDALKLKSKVLTYGKLRASWARVGNDANPYLLTSVFSKGSIENGYSNTDLNFPFNGVPGFERGNRIGNENLQPEITSATEVGTDLGFFKDRIGVDFTYYSNVSTNQIINVPIAPSSGYTAQTINAGKITNKGIELLVRATPIRMKNNGFKWNFAVTYTQNRSLVEKIYGEGDAEIKEIAIGEAGASGLASASVVAAVGKPYGTFSVVGPRTVNDEANGKIIVDPTTGLPLIDPKPKYYGSYQPKYLLGITNTFSFKGFELNFLFDIRKGGVFYSRTKDVQEFVGTAPSTLYNDREDFYVQNSVIEVEAPVRNEKGEITKQGVYQDNVEGKPNAVKANAQDYWTDQTNYANDLLDASFVKLRELAVSYTVPKSISDRTPFGNIQVGISGRNLLLWTPKENTYVDPEMSSMGNGNAQGYDFGGIPSIRSIGANIRVTF